MTAKKRICLDHAATTPLDPRVKKAMDVFGVEKFGNPSSLHQEGRDAKEALGNARIDIAKILNARANEIVFTSGGTESNNLAILGIVMAIAEDFKHLPPSRLNPSSLREVGSDADSGSKCLKSSARDADSSSKQLPPALHIITTKIEHPSVLNVCQELEKCGVEVTYLDVNKDGILNPEDVKKALRENTVLVSVMYANNEIGTIQPIKEIAKVIRDFHKKKKSEGKAPIFHTDACQASGYLDLDVNKLGVDLMTINGSKIYGPKGIGLLYVGKGIKLHPMIYGGSQERGLRAGTENVPGIIGIAESLKISDKEKTKEVKRLSALRDYFIKKLTTDIPEVYLNGHSEKRLPNNINVSVLGAEGEAIVLYLDEAGIACSTGSACSSDKLEASHVIMALGKPQEYGHGSLRFTMGRNTTKADMDYVLKVLPGIIKKLRSFSPVKA